METFKIAGLIAAPFTPMKNGGEINLEIIPAYAKKLKTDGLSGVFICGTTGEGMLMTAEERKAIAEKWIEEQNDDFKAIVHVGTTSAKQSTDLARHARKAGAYAVAAIGPLFLKPSRIEELIGFCAEIAEGAPDLPFYYYHIPSVSGVDFPMAEFLEKAAVRIPNLAGIKYTHNNFTDMQKCLEMNQGKWDILHGYDELLLAGLAFGAKGAVGSTYNYMAKLYFGIIDDFENGKIAEAAEKQALAVRIVDVLIRYNGALVSGKNIMKSFGIDCGQCRYPLNNLSDEEYDRFLKDMQGAGFFNI
jgi:N-acetylneuraminate lyase